MKTTVHLHGELADAVGRPIWSFAVDTPAEALRAIEANTNGKLVDYLIKNKETEFRFVMDGEDAECLEDITLVQRQMQELHVMPVVRGQGSSTGGIFAIIGLVLIAVVVTIFTMGAGAPLASTLFAVEAGAITGLTGVGSFVLTLGIGLTLSGFASMLAPTPKVDDVERPENKPSYIFNGAVNTYRQGNPVPIGFGIFTVGSQVISAGIKAADIIE